MTAGGVMRWARIALGVAVVAAIVPATLVVVAVEPVPTIIIPVVLAAIPLVGESPSRVRALSLAVSVLLAAFVILGGFSVGFLFVPSLLAVLVAALIAR